MTGSELGLFLNLDEETILAIQAKALADALQGRVILNWQGEGTSVGKQFALPIADVLSECRYALQNLYPETYGFRLTKVRPFFA